MKIVSRLFQLVLLLFELALRSLFASKTTLVLLLAAVVAGAGFQVANVANLKGYTRALLAEGIEHGLGDVRIYPGQGDRFEDAHTLAAAVRKIPGVIQANRVLMMPGAIGKRRFLSAVVLGIESGNRMPYRLLRGRPLAPDDNEGILVGSSLAKELAVKPGDRIRLRVVLGGISDVANDEAIGRYDRIVRGIVSGTFGAHVQVFVSAAFLGQEIGERNAASVVVAHLADHEQDEAVARAVNQDLDAGFPTTRIKTWRQDSAYLRSAVGTSEAISWITHLMVGAAVALPVWALFHIYVLRRRRDMAVMGALGFRRGELFGLLGAAGSLVGLVGGLGGGLLGRGLIFYFDRHPLFDWEGFVVRPVGSAADLFRPVVFVVVTTCLASIVPAITAARTPVAKILREVS